jgi:peptide/nickel transport system substrate-binding protein
MNKLFKRFMVGAAAIAVGALVVIPATAQDGGIIVEGNAAGDVANMNPLLASDTASRRITALTNIGFLGVDVENAVIAPNTPGALVADWSLSDDGLIYTFNLRQDLVWSDGTPITSTDIMYAWEATKLGAEGVIDVPGAFVIDPSGETGILNVTAPDEYTVVVEFASAECTSLGNAGILYPVPSHVLPADLTTLDDAEYNLAPTVTSGPFNFSELRPGEQVALIGNDSYVDALEGTVVPEGFIYRNVPDQNVSVEQFLAGELNFIDTPAVARRDDIRNSGSQVYGFPGNSWDYMAFNLADPNNPQNAFDTDGNPIDQGNHPIFGDVRVRQAIARAVNVDSLIESAVFNEGQRMTSFIIPASWAYNNDLPPITFDQEAARALLAEAGWADTDGDGVLEATEDALYAEAGSEFVFTLFTNQGNGRREAIGTLIQDQLSQVGIRVDFQTIDFNTLLDILDSQTFDTVIIGWRNGYPDDPDATQLFTPQSDVIGSGSNFTSFNNERFTELNTLAKNVPGCDPAERATYYYEMQEIMQTELPYLWLFVQNGFYAAGSSVNGFDPFPSAPLWNVDAWAVSTP